MGAHNMIAIRGGDILLVDNPVHWLCGNVARYPPRNEIYHRTNIEKYELDASAFP